jgi:murein DD-endopeptidase MepM/ murein hydrolase activator NlpD
MDIKKTNAFGFGAAGLYPDENDAYFAFGAEIVAPCAGEVISVNNDKPNRAPLDPDGTDTEGGNHVTLFCQGHSVHLAHMDTGSVAVSIGDQVSPGQLLGRVGNSGNSMEPHLHISAAAGRHPRFREPSDPVQSTPILIDGRFLMIGDSFAN